MTSVVATSLKSTGDLLEMLTKINDRSILFIDEIHGLNKKLEESLYDAMEDYSIHHKLGNKEIVKIKISPFCLIGATTCPGKIATPLRDRFDIHHNMEFYSDDELTVIIKANAGKLNLKLEDNNAMSLLASRSRGTPRIANRLLKRVRDFAQITNNGIINSDSVNSALALEGIDSAGLSKIDKRYIFTLFKIYNAGPAGIDAIAASTGDDRTTVSEVVEPFLVRKQFIARTKQGRILTKKGIEYILSYANKK